jgi:tetratricopeptide (TPR) repeat protein
MRHAIRTLAVVLLAIPVLNCARVQAQTALREGHRLYKDESFRKAIDQYRVVLEKDPGSIEATFYLGSSFHQLFRPGKDETKVNLEEAIKNYKQVLTSQASADDKKFPILKKNALSALIGIYADDPYRDFDTSMKYATELTSSEPGNLQNLFAMANLFEKFGKVNEAEAAYRKAALEIAPKDPKACGALAGFYNKTLWDDKGVPITDGSAGRGRFDDAVNQLKVCAELDPKDPKGYYTVATFYWDQCYRGPLLEDEKKKELADEGMEFVNKALSIKSDFVEALIYKGLLLREQAKLTKNPATRNSLLEEAGILQKQAVELKKQQDAELAEKAKAAAAMATTSN